MIILYVFRSQINIAETTIEIDSHISTTEVLNISFVNNILTNRIEKKVAMTDISTSNTNTTRVFMYFVAYLLRV
jgi:hypothetical protein